jgi:predicted  nucleic acid-binding Zn-ribbon protein
MAYEQLELFPKTQEEILEAEVKKLRESNEKVRKKLFHENTKLKKMYNDLYYEFEQLKAAICRGQ